MSETAGGEPRSRDVLDRLDHRIARIEAILLVFILATMVFLSLMQFILRKSLDLGFEWADLLIRQLVLWLGFIGGALATYQGHHIAIDAVCKLLPPRRRAAMGATAGTLAAGITAVMTRAAYIFVQDERAAGSPGIGAVPAWVLAGVIPMSLALITFHFLIRARHLALVALGRRDAPDPAVPRRGAR